LLSYGFRSKNGKAIVAYWVAAHSVPGNYLPPYYATITLKNSGIQQPVLIDVVSGDIRPLNWMKGTTDTLEMLPVTDSILAIADADYFDWPVLPEAPSTLTAASIESGVKLSWEVHGGNPEHVVVERRQDSTARGSWQRIAELPASATHYSDSQVKPGQKASYRVRATNANGNSATSNIVRVPGS
jgi:hypothetical protein